MSPEEIVNCIDFRYITDVITAEESIAMLHETQKGKADRMKEAFENTAVPAYTTSPGWLAFTGDKMKKVLEDTIAEGYTVFKFKVGSNLEADRKRLAAVRDVLGYDKGYQIMIDANQVWSVPEAIEYMKHLVEFKPVFIEGKLYPVALLIAAGLTTRRTYQPRRRSWPRSDPQGTEALRCGCCDR